jgi:hypothetical protein
MAAHAMRRELLAALQGNGYKSLRDYDVAY